MTPKLMNKINLSNELLIAVEQAILDLAETNASLRQGICIQPLAKWKDQASVLDFYALLRKRFGQVLKDFT